MIEPQPEDLAAAEVVDAARVKTENRYAREEIVGSGRSAAIAENETIIAEEIVENVTTDGADQAETAVIVETVHAHGIVTVIEDEATAHAVEVAAASEETVTDPEHLLLHTEMRLPLRLTSKLKSRSESKRRRNTSLRRRRLERKACRFLGGLIEGER